MAVNGVLDQGEGVHLLSGVNDDQNTMIQQQLEDAADYGAADYNQSQG